MKLRYTARSLLAVFDIIHLPAVFFGLMTIFMGTPLYSFFRTLSISPAYLLVLLYITHIFLMIIIALYIATWVDTIKHKKPTGKIGIVLDIVLIAVLIVEIIYMNEWAWNLKYF